MEIDPYENDPARWAHSLAHLTEILLPCLDAAGARSVVEVGAYAGDLTRVLLQWASGVDARVYAVDPTPHESLVRLAAERNDLELIRETSLQALPRIPLPDAVVIDGDHNYYTVEHELEAIGARAEGADMPLLLLHDVGWPHGRRDSYFAPERIPEADRQEIAEGGGLMPGVQGIRPGGLPYRAAAAREGGARNGVRTAVEDFVKGRQGLQLAIVPAFFGLGVVWHRDSRLGGRSGRHPGAMGRQPPAGAARGQSGAPPRTLVLPDHTDGACRGAGGAPGGLASPDAGVECLRSGRTTVAPTSASRNRR